jgi:hypothetical protein
MKKYLPYVFAVLLFAFAALTFFLSTSVIFDLFDVRAAQGNYVLFIVVNNFICSLLYFIAVYGFIKKKSWTVYALATALSLLVLVFVYFVIYINNGGIYEEKTYGAMLFRIAVTVVFTSLAYFLVPKKPVLV